MGGEVVHCLAFRLWLVVSMLHTVVSVVKRAAPGLEPGCLPVRLGGSVLVIVSRVVDATHAVEDHVTPGLGGSAVSVGAFL